MTEGAFIRKSPCPRLNCYDLLPLSLFYLDILTFWNYICKASDTHKRTLLCDKSTDASGAKTKQLERDDNYCWGSSRATDRKWWKICNEAWLFRLDLE